jgi:Secretion system C-terminal sorting domain/PKD domain
VMYVWSYGDGTYGTSTTPTMSHNYTTSGSYDVCMTVQVFYKGTICDCSKKICKKIQISQGAVSSSGCTSSLTSTTASGEVGQLKASPNPSSHDFHVTLDKMESVLENGKAEIRLYNVQGKLILTKTIDVLTKEFDIQAESYPAGLYMMTLQKDGEVISSIKVVKN